MKAKQTPGIFEGMERAFVSREHCCGNIAAEARMARQSNSSPRSSAGTICEAIRLYMLGAGAAAGRRSKKKNKERLQKKARKQFGIGPLPKTIVVYRKSYLDIN